MKQGHAFLLLVRFTREAEPSCASAGNPGRAVGRAAADFLFSKLAAEIAYKLGYSERSAFTRAAIRWFGVPPSGMR